jgi:hypothetical protein
MSTLRRIQDQMWPDGTQFWCSTFFWVPPDLTRSHQPALTHWPVCSFDADPRGRPSIKGNGVKGWSTVRNSELEGRIQRSFCIFSMEGGLDVSFCLMAYKITTLRLETASSKRLRFPVQFLEAIRLEASSPFYEDVRVETRRLSKFKFRLQINQRNQMQSQSMQHGKDSHIHVSSTSFF